MLLERAENARACFRDFPFRDFPFVEEILKSAESLVVWNDRVQRSNVHREDKTVCTPETESVQYGQHVARVLHVAVQLTYKRCCNLR